MNLIGELKSNKKRFMDLSQEEVDGFQSVLDRGGTLELLDPWQGWGLSVVKNLGSIQPGSIIRIRKEYKQEG